MRKGQLPNCSLIEDFRRPYGANIPALGSKQKAPKQIYTPIHTLQSELVLQQVWYLDGIAQCPRGLYQHALQCHFHGSTFSGKELILFKT